MNCNSFTDFLQKHISQNGGISTLSVPEMTEKDLDALNQIKMLWKKHLNTLTIHDVFKMVSSGTPLTVKFNGETEFEGIEVELCDARQNAYDSNLYDFKIRNINLSGATDDARFNAEDYDIFGKDFYFSPGIYKYLDHEVDDKDKHLVFEFEIVD